MHKLRQALLLKMCTACFHTSCCISFASHFTEPLGKLLPTSPSQHVPNASQTCPQHHNTAVPWSLRSTLCFKIPTKQMLSHHTRRDIFNLQQPSPDVRHPPKIPQNTSQKHDSRKNLTAGAAQRIQTDSTQLAAIHSAVSDCYYTGRLLLGGL